MKVLILSCNTGQGHNTAGKAIQETFLSRGVECRMMDTLLLASEKVSRRVSGAYCGLTTRFPRGFGWLYKAGDAISSPKRKSPVYLANIPYARTLLELIRQGGYDRIVTPHLFPAEALTHLRKQAALDVPCYAVATDYACIPFWEETSLDRYFIPHKDLVPEFIQKGVPESKLIPLGIPVSARFRQHTPKAGAREALGLPAEGIIYLVMTGSMGYGNVEDMAAELLRRGGNVCVLGGNNRKMKEGLRQRFRDNPRMMVLDFTDQVSLYMDACDVLLTKPGGLTSTEAAVKNIALVHTAPIPGCETINARFFSQRGMSLCGETAEKAVEEAVRLAEDLSLREAMLEAQRTQLNPLAADEICDRITMGL